MSETNESEEGFSPEWAKEANEDTGADASPEPEVEPTVEVEAEAEDATEPESAADSPPAEEEDLEEKTNPVQDRIDRLTRNWRTTQRENEELRQQLEQQAKPEPATPPADLKGLSDFDYDERAYQTYLMGEMQKITQTTAEKVLKEARERERQEAIQVEHRKREVDFAKTVKDYREVVHDELTISPAMADVIRDSDIGPEVAYYLGKHPNQAYEISRMPAVAAVREVVAIEGELKAKKTEARAKKVSAAPPPPSTKVGSGNAGVKKISPNEPASDKLSDEEWFKREEARTAKQRQRG